MQHAKINMHTEHFSQHWQHLLQHTLFLQKIIPHDMTNWKHEKYSVYPTLARNRAYLTAKDTDIYLRYYHVYVSFPVCHTETCIFTFTYNFVVPCFRISYGFATGYVFL
jgi:hypothetical protein